MNKDLEALKLRMLNSHVERNVENWNILRENAKADFNTQVIYDLDASAFIKVWMKSERYNEKN